MIQRRQTLYLFFVAIICSLTLFFPLAEITFTAPDALVSIAGVSDGGTYTIWGIEYLNGEKDPFVYHGYLTILSVILPIIIIFLYRKRELQFRLCIVEGIFVLGLVGFAVMGILRLGTITQAPGYVVNHTIWALSPIVALPFIVMSCKRILKDIWLLRDSDRIR